MKKIIFVLVALASLQINAQSFYKGALVTDMGVGIDVYKVREHQVNKTNNTSKDTTDRAGSKNFSLGAEYGLAKWFGLGLRAKFDNYFTSKDTSTKTTPTAKGFEIGAVANFHIVRKNHFNLVAGLNVGYSHLNIAQNDAAGDIIYGNGTWAVINITPRFYFKRFGLYLNLNFPFITYSPLTTNNDAFNKDYSVTWKGSGTSINFGIQYRFLKERK